MSKSDFRQWWDNTNRTFGFLPRGQVFNIARIAWSAGGRKAVQLERAAQKRAAQRSEFGPPPTEAEAEGMIGALTNQPPINWKRRALKTHARALKAEAERDALFKYAEHKPECGVSIHGTSELCDCGLADIRDEIRKGEG